MSAAEKLRALRGDTPRSAVVQSVGISTSALSMYEHGERVPRDEIKCKLANYYGVTVQEIFFDSVEHETCTAPNS